MSSKLSKRHTIHGLSIKRDDTCREFVTAWNLRWTEIDSTTGAAKGFSDAEGLGQLAPFASLAPFLVCYTVWKSALASILVDDSATSDAVQAFVPSPSKLAPRARDGTRLFDAECGHSIGYLAAECHLKVQNFEEALGYNAYQLENYVGTRLFNAFQRGRILAARTKE